MESTKKSSIISVGILTGKFDICRKMINLCNNLINSTHSVSDSCSQGLAVDASGPHLIDLVKGQFSPTTLKYDVIPDDMDKIEVPN